MKHHFEQHNQVEVPHTIAEFRAEIARLKTEEITQFAATGEGSAHFFNLARVEDLTEKDFEIYCLLRNNQLTTAKFET